MSNLRQMGLGMLQYGQDYDERTISNSVTGSLGVSGASKAISWTVALYPYTKSRDILRCASNTKPLAIMGSNSFTGDTNTLNYTYNGFVGGQNCGTSLPVSPGRSLSQIQLPSQTPLLVEAVGIAYAQGTNTVDQSLTFMVAGSTQPDPTYTVLVGKALYDPVTLLGKGGSGTAWTGSDMNRYPATSMGFLLGSPGANVHFGATNFLFADGHVKSLKSPVPEPPSGIQPPLPSLDLDYCPDGVVGTTTTYG